MKKYLLKNPFLIILGSIICLVSCGPTEVSVDVEEVNIDTKLNTSITIPHSTPKTVLQGNIQPPVVIPTPIGLEAMTEVLKSVSSVSENLQETAKTFGDIFSSLNTSTQIILFGTQLQSLSVIQSNYWRRGVTMVFCQKG